LQIEKCHEDVSCRIAGYDQPDAVMPGSLRRSQQKMDETGFIHVFDELAARVIGIQLKPFLYGRGNRVAMGKQRQEFKSIFLRYLIIFPQCS